MMYDGKKWIVIANWGQSGRKETAKLWPMVKQGVMKGNARLNALGTIIGVLTSFAFYKKQMWDSKLSRDKELAETHKKIGELEQELKTMKTERQSMQEGLKTGEKKGWFW
jgi:hypothetical protein